tara:strand:+ start:2404 stop:2808 length:405 start_codon:yes stop_codon:yes gene_type:complete
MPRRTARSTKRSSKPSNLPKRQYSQNSSTPSSQYQQANIPQNSAMGNIAQGMTLGAGAAIGSSMVHGALGSMSSSKETPKEQTYENYQQLQEDEIRCGHLMRQFKDCCTSYNDLNNCKPLLEYYVSCMSNNTKF